MEQIMFKKTFIFLFLTLSIIGANGMLKPNNINRLEPIKEDLEGEQLSLLRQMLDETFHNKIKINKAKENLRKKPLEIIIPAKVIMEKRKMQESMITSPKKHDLHKKSSLGSTCFTPSYKEYEEQSTSS